MTQGLLVGKLLVGGLGEITNGRRLPHLLLVFLLLRIVIIIGMIVNITIIISAKIDNGSGIRDPRVEIWQSEIMRTDCNQGEALVEHYWSDAGVLQRWRVLQREPLV